jgi:simple sugar transport system ATP-binding protein
VLDAATTDTSEEELIRIVKSGLGSRAIDAAAEGEPEAVHGV